jgi:anti-sigma regulatory factor (Ser/Thr protein kinase)
MPAGQHRRDAAAGVFEQEFGAATLHALREAVLAHAAAAGMPANRALDVMLALHELAANAVRHGAGSGRLRMRVTSAGLYCQVSDAGPLARRGGQPLDGTADGYDPDGADSATEQWPFQHGHGLWLVRQAADEVSVVSGPRGSVVTVVFRMPATAATPGTDGGRDLRG